METKKKKLPVGIEMFRDIREHDFYYIDKTGFIKELLESWTEVNLFTRPRRFGKSLNMDMLKAFFEIGTDKRLFDGLEISAEKQICEEYMGKFSVISVSLKDVEGNSFEEAKDMLETVISDEALRFQYLMDSPKLTLYEKPLEPLLTGRFEKTSQLTASLKTLSALLYKHTGTEVIILIDEYDVPLDKAYVNGYYEQMVQLIRSLFSQVLKTNSNLRFAVITGCLRISKESIFTGINNFTVHTVSDSDYGEYFGFTDQEVRGLLSYYEMEELYPVVKEWYDGYQFGKEEIYCPWDVLNYIREHIGDRNVPPKLYWINTSGNYIVKRFIERANQQTRREIEQLIEGKAIQKEITSLKDEVDRISTDTEYNSKTLLDGSLDTRVYTKNATRVDISDHVKAGQYQLSIDTAATQAGPVTANQNYNSTAPVGASGTMSINGSKVEIEAADTYAEAFEKIRNAAETGETTVQIDGTSGALSFTADRYGMSSILEMDLIISSLLRHLDLRHPEETVL